MCPLFFIYTLSFMTIMSGIMYYDSTYNYIFTKNLPKNYNLKTQPMVLVNTNWTCQSSYIQYEKQFMTSDMNIDSTWWKECNPTHKCFIISTWTNLEYNMDGIPETNRYLRYYLDIPKKIIYIKNQGQNSRPEYKTRIFPNNSKYKYKFYESQCLAKLTFRNVLNGNYFVETTYNPTVYNKLGVISNILWNVTYFDNCHFSIYFDISNINHQTHCIKEINKLDMSSFDIINQYKQ